MIKNSCIFFINGYLYLISDISPLDNVKRDVYIKFYRMLSTRYRIDALDSGKPLRVSILQKQLRFMSRKITIRPCSLVLLSLFPRLPRVSWFALAEEYYTRVGSAQRIPMRFSTALYFNKELKKREGEREREKKMFEAR